MGREVVTSSSMFPVVKLDGQPWTLLLGTAHLGPKGMALVAASCWVCSVTCWRWTATTGVAYCNACFSAAARALSPTWAFVHQLHPRDFKVSVYITAQAVDEWTQGHPAAVELWEALGRPRPLHVFTRVTSRRAAAEILARLPGVQLSQAMRRGRWRW